ncbi:hypothetical protein AGRHK599_LOCUS1279 [Rhizobium rhizogenes]|uniref:Uncharacterized protein n=1 Tax=Rhizobium rhizogenes TaxID=359 RepID=A0AAN2DCI8_RHIRH|nr:hypothetical protein AGRHK599_LOCUS1279 [Rhizobium rhizogenes]
MTEKQQGKGYIAQMTNPLRDPRARAIVEEARREYQENSNAKKGS